MSYTHVTSQPPPWASPEPDPVADWHREAAARVAKGMPKADALAAVLRSDPDLVERLEKSTPPPPPEPPSVKKLNPLGLAGQLLENAAVAIRKTNGDLTHAQAVAQAAAEHPDWALDAMAEDAL